MSQLRVVIVDDEAPARRLLRRLAEASQVLVVGEAGDAVTAIDVIRATAPDLVFLDIQMPDGDGFAVVSALESTIPLFIFVTAFDQFAVRAFEANAVDYLLKPFDDERFARALERARARKPLGDRAMHELVRQLSFTPSQTFVERLPVPLERGRTAFQLVEDIDWLEAERKLVHLHVGKSKRTIRDSIGRLEEVLDPARFIRVSRSAIVNVRGIREIQSLVDGDYLLLLGTGDKVPTTRAYRDRILRLLGKTRL